MSMKFGLSNTPITHFNNICVGDLPQGVHSRDVYLILQVVYSLASFILVNCKVCGCYSVQFMFSNFYWWDSHNKTRVTLANLRWKRKKLDWKLDLPWFRYEWWLDKTRLFSFFYNFRKPQTRLKRTSETKHLKLNSNRKEEHL